MSQCQIIQFRPKKQSGYRAGWITTILLLLTFASAIMYWQLGHGKSQIPTYIPTINASSIPILDICFRKNGPSCAALVINEINSAEETIDFEFYQFTRKDILEALQNATIRGVKIRSIGDRTSAAERGSQISKLPGEVYVDCSVTIHHDKVIIIDGQSVGTGSYNFTYQAENRNAENHIWIHDTAVATVYEADFEAQLAESTKGTVCK